MNLPSFCVGGCAVLGGDVLVGLGESPAEEEAAGDLANKYPGSRSAAEAAGAGEVPSRANPVTAASAMSEAVTRVVRRFLRMVMSGSQLLRKAISAELTSAA